MTLGDRLRLEAEQLADAVVLVDDVVAGAQVGERLERAAERARRRAAAACGRPACRAGARARARARRSRAARARRRTRGPASRGSSPPGRRRARASTRRSIACVRSASPRCGKATTRGGPARTRPASSFSASARPRAAIAGRCASNENGWPCGQRVELARRPERRARRRAPRAQTSRTSSACQTRSGGAVEQRHEVVRRCAELRRLVVRRASARRGRAPLGGRVDQRVVDGVQRALRERREGADRLDLVAEELDPERLAAGGREDVDDAAADGELAALLGLLDALVAGERERLGEAVDAGLVADADRDRRRAARRRAAARSASASADAKTRPPRASTSSARARSPTRCGGGSRPDSQRTPRLGRSPTRSAPRYQPAASAASRASASSGSDARRAGGRGARAARRRTAAAQPRRRGRACREAPRRSGQPLVRGELRGERVQDRTVRGGGAVESSACGQRVTVKPGPPLRTRARSCHWAASPLQQRVDRRCRGTRRRRARAGRRR